MARGLAGGGLFGSASHIAVRGPAGDGVIPLGDLLRRFGADLAIRMHDADFALLAGAGPVLTHFNPPDATNHAGARCVLLPIVRPGRLRADGSEALPVVDPERFRMATCEAFIPRLAFDAVTADQFATSLPTIRTAAELRAVLVSRYRDLVPGGAPAILAGGCSATRLLLDAGPSPAP